jgi:hypothetical protein
MYPTGSVSEAEREEGSRKRQAFYEQFVRVLDCGFVLYCMSGSENSHLCRACDPLRT